MFRYILFSATFVGFSACASVEYSYASTHDQAGREIVYYNKHVGKYIDDPVYRSQTYRLTGLVDKNYREIVPPEYKIVAALGPEFALAWRPDETIVAVKLPEGKLSPTVYSRKEAVYSHPDLKETLYLVSNLRSDKRFDMTLIDKQRGLGPTMRDVGGRTVDTRVTRITNAAVARHGDCLIIHSTTNDGDAVSRLYTPDGSPVTPIIPRMVNLPYEVHREQTYKNEEDWAFPIGDLEDPTLPSSMLYQPLATDCKPVPLPAGAVGMIPIPIRDDGSHRAWAIVYNTPQGRRFGVGIGKATEIVAQAEKLERVEGIAVVRKYYRSWSGGLNIMEAFAWKRAGAVSWEFVQTENLKPHTDFKPTQSYATAEALIGAWDASLREDARRAAEKQAAIQRAAAERPQRQREEAIRNFPEYLKNGEELEARRALQYLGPDALIKVVARFGALSNEELEALRGSGASSEVVKRAQKRLLENEEALRKVNENARLEAERRKQNEICRYNCNYVEQPNPDAEWRAYLKNLNQQQKGPDPVIQRLHQQYYENLERWNKGEQHWVPRKF